MNNFFFYFFLFLFIYLFFQMPSLGLNFFFNSFLIAVLNITFFIICFSNLKYMVLTWNVLRMSFLAGP